MNLTKSSVDRLSPPISGQKIYRDDRLKGFGVRITAGGTKTFIVEKRINRKVRRQSLAKYPELTVEQARKEAQRLLGRIASGADPIAEKKEAKAKSVPLRQVFDEYVKTRKSLKASTIADYRRVMREAFPDWQGKRIGSIKKEMVARRHTELGARSEARANLAMRVLRALFNFAAHQYEDGRGRPVIVDNPVKRLSQTRAWYKVERRNSVIKAHQLPGWYRAVMSLGEDDLSGMGATVRDYLLLLLFTGLRREEALQLRWEQVDLDARTLTIADPKNRQSHTLPLPDFVYDILTARRQDSASEYVFPGHGPKGHPVFIARHLRKVVERSGVEFTLHDLRRTFITVAESQDISAYTVKRLANHKIAGDVTAGYIHVDVERLRRPMHIISSYLVSAMGKREDNCTP